MSIRTSTSGGLKGPCTWLIEVFRLTQPKNSEHDYSCHGNKRWHSLNEVYEIWVNTILINPKNLNTSPIDPHPLSFDSTLSSVSSSTTKRDFGTFSSSFDSRPSVPGTLSVDTTTFPSLSQWTPSSSVVSVSVIRYHKYLFLDILEDTPPCLNRLVMSRYNSVKLFLMSFVELVFPLQLNLSVSGPESRSKPC